MFHQIRNKAEEIRLETMRFLHGLLEANLLRNVSLIVIIGAMAASVLYVIEGPDTFGNPFNAFWWALVTMTTVGYGDITPEGTAGKAMAMLVIIAGVALVSIFTASISSAFIASKLREGRGLQDVLFKDHIVIAGWYPGAEALVEAVQSLSRSKVKVVFVNELTSDEVETLLLRFKPLKPKFVRGDTVQEVVLKRAGIDKASAVLILPVMKDMFTAAQVDQHTILTALTCKDINPKVKVFAYALEEKSIPHLRRGGVDRVVVRDAYAGYLLASHALAPGVPEVVDELLTLDRGHQIERIPVPNQLVGKTVRDLQDWTQNQFHGILIGLVSEEKVIETDDILSSDMSSIDAFIKRKFEEAGRSAEELATTNIEINPPENKPLSKGELAVIIRADQSGNSTGGV